MHYIFRHIAHLPFHGTLRWTKVLLWLSQVQEWQNSFFHAELERYACSHKAHSRLILTLMCPRAKVFPDSQEELLDLIYPRSQQKK